mmetsp:Transcript_33758/g.93269  ORF Transcript_33758/g.93269 Transcript_33758/m.93269 type:complete len:118 (-) Transcript_33758:147-500(-)
MTVGPPVASPSNGKRFASPICGSSTGVGARMAYPSRINITETPGRERPGVTKSTRPSKMTLGPGVKVNYVSKSHGGVYKAVIVGREPGRNAWKVRVESGGDKTVEDSEMWRIQPSSW